CPGRQKKLVVQPAVRLDAELRILLRDGFLQFLYFIWALPLVLDDFLAAWVADGPGSQPTLDSRLDGAPFSRAVGSWHGRIFRGRAEPATAAKPDNPGAGRGRS